MIFFLIIPPIYNYPHPSPENGREFTFYKIYILVIVKECEMLLRKITFFFFFINFTYFCAKICTT